MMKSLIKHPNIIYLIDFVPIIANTPPKYIPVACARLPGSRLQPSFSDFLKYLVKYLD